ncbi:MAG TPA: STAS domain-containing protein [Gemmataceae bacterium]|nr:STAS domain-containing protein [Gemmataceae bacterium]
MASRTDTSTLELSLDGDRAVVLLPHPRFGTVEREAEDEHLVSLLAQLPQDQLSLDFRKVSFLTSLGLAMLITLHKRLTGQGRRLVLINLQPHVYELFSVTYLNTLLDVRLQEAA